MAKVKNERVQFWLVLLLCLILRVLFLSSREIQYDDAFSILLSRQSLANIVSGTAVDTMPPLYYFLLHFWMAVSSNLAWMRLLGVILSLGCVALLYTLVRSIIDHHAAVWAALLASISPLQIYHAQDLRMYTLLAISQLGYYWFFYRLFLHSETNKTNKLNWVGLILAGTAAMYSHNLAIFGLVVPDIFLILKRRWGQLKHLLLAQCCVLVLSLPWLLFVPGQIQKIQNAFWIPRPGLVEVIQAVVQLHATLPLTGIWLGIAVILSFQALIMVIWETWKRFRGNEGIQLLGLIVLFIPLQLFAVSYFMRPIFVARGFIVSSLAYYGLAGVVISRSFSKGPGKVVVGLFIAAALISLPGQYAFNSFPRSPFRELTDELTRQIQPGDVILHDNKLSFFPMEYYNHNLPQVFLPDEPGSHNDTLAPGSQQALGLFPVRDLQTGIEDATRVAFVVFQKAIDEYTETGEQDHPILLELKRQFTLTGEIQINDLRCFFFER